MHRLQYASVSAFLVDRGNEVKIWQWRQLMGLKRQETKWPAGWTSRPAQHAMSRASVALGPVEKLEDAGALRHGLRRSNGMTSRTFCLRRHHSGIHYPFSLGSIRHCASALPFASSSAIRVCFVVYSYDLPFLSVIDSDDCCHCRW